jgi:hypothetical protein
MYYKQLNVSSNIIDNLKKKIETTTDDQWKNTLEQELISLSIDDFSPDPAIKKLITDIGNINRLSIYRFFEKECYNWHIDVIRESSINMLITGFDSMCIFGNPIKNRRFNDISKLQHEPAQYYIMNVKKMHTVYNFGNETRHVLSIGLPNVKYEDACKYLQDNDLLKTNYVI